MTSDEQAVIIVFIAVPVAERGRARMDSFC